MPTTTSSANDVKSKKPLERKWSNELHMNILRNNKRITKRPGTIMKK